MHRTDLLVDPGLIGGGPKPISVIADQHGRPDARCKLADPVRQRHLFRVFQQIDGERQAMHRINPDAALSLGDVTFDAGQVGTQRADEELTCRQADRPAPER